jgi:hypothetical protein
MGINSLFITEEPKDLCNFDAAILLQLLLQTFGEGKLDELIEEIALKAIQRIANKTETEYLGRE